MKKEIRWGIMGPGNIAHKFASGLSLLKDANLYAVGSRTLDKSQIFGDKYGIPKRYGSYEELANDKEVDAIYIATPHPFHKENAMMCLKAGKAVLCEKPFTVNSQDAAEVITLARESGIFLMEAMWNRFLPAMVKLREWLAEGLIGEVRMLTADFGFRTGVTNESRLFNPTLAGGALLDVGIYTLSLASMVFGVQPSRIAAMAHIGETGVDEQSSMTLGYDGGQLAQLSSAIRTETPQGATIIGTLGYIYIPGFWHAANATVHIKGKEPQSFEIPFEGIGYQYEAQEVMNCLREGRTESKIMPLQESLDIMRTMDKVREQCGLKFPIE